MLLSPHIADAVDRLDIVLRSQLIPKPFDSHRQGIFIYILRSIRPDAVDQIATAHSVALIFHQQTKELLFCFAEFYVGTVCGKLHLVKVKYKTVNLKSLCRDRNRIFSYGGFSI